MVLKSRPVVTMAGAKADILGSGWPSGYGQGLWEVLTIKLRGIKPRPNPDHKKDHRLGGW